MSGHRGDDFDDDYVPDELVASSGEEDLAAPDGVEGLLSADESGKEEGRKEISAKRKRREREKERRAKKRKLEDTGPALVAAQSPQLLAGYLSSMQARVFPTMSGLELLDVSIPETSITDTRVWTESRSLDRLAEFIISALPTLHKRLSQKSKALGSPTLLFIAGAALRVADVARVLKHQRQKLCGEKGGAVAKLFAKHVKLKEHVSYLRRTRIGSAVGTPGRVGKLLCETDALSVSQLTHIILDISYQDAKTRNVLDIPETRDDVFKSILRAPKVFQGIKEGKIQVVLF